MAIGINWAEVWAPVWKAVWTQSPPTPTTTPVDVTPTPAGKARRKPRYFLEIDGQQFLVDSAAQATQLLQQARAIAERQAEQAAGIAEKRARSKAAVPRVTVDAPEITASPDLLADVRPLIDDIKRLYRQAGELAELRLLMAREIAKQQADDEDDDETILLLM